MNYNISVFIKATRTKVQQKIITKKKGNIQRTVCAKRRTNSEYNLQFVSSCLICDSEEENGKNGSFSSIDSLLRHLRTKHNDHTIVKRYKLGLNHLQSVFDYWKPRR